MTPGVAKIPEPITLDMMRKYADDQLMFRPADDASGRVLSSADGVLGVRSGVSRGVRGSSGPYGSSNEPFSYLVLISKNRIGGNLLPAFDDLEVSGNSGSEDSTSDGSE